MALKISNALEEAHGRGVIHRDIKPHNVLLTSTGDVKVADFGIARASAYTAISQTSLVLGTAGYMSPEQALGEPVDPPERPLLPGRGPLRDAHRRATLYGRQPGGRFHETRQRTTAAAAGDKPRDNGRHGRRRYETTRQKTRGPLRGRDRTRRRPPARARRDAAARRRSGRERDQPRTPAGRNPPARALAATGVQDKPPASAQEHALGSGGGPVAAGPARRPRMGPLPKREQRQPGKHGATEVRGSLP